MSEVLNQIEKVGVVPVVALERAEDAKPLAEALLAGGLPVAEVTFRTSAAVEAMKAMAEYPELLVGAGTVLTRDAAQQASDAGAKFLVSPGFNAKVVTWAKENGLPIAPGVVTPTEIEQALDHGITTVKFFPAEAVGGLKALKAMAAPYGMMRFMPTGGIGPSNLADYLAFEKVVACGGSWMVDKKLMKNRDFEQITRLAREAVDLAARARG